MGVMRFLVHPPEMVGKAPELREGYLSGLDGRIFPARVDLQGSLVVIQRPQADSARFSVPWPVAGFGRPVLSTTSLREREDPYLLLLELARGKLAEVREQAAVWEMAQLQLPDAFHAVQRQAFQSFARASSLQKEPDRSSQHATEAIQLACQAAAILMDAYVVQRMTSLHQSAHHSPGLLGCTIDSEVLTKEGSQIFQQVFNAASIPFDWHEIEAAEGTADWDSVDAMVRYCSEHRMVCRGGPLINLAPHGLPEWLAPWKSDFLNLPSFVCDFIETAMSRYQGIIRLWEVAAYGNTGGALDLSEEHRLALVARVLESARRTDNNAMLMLRIDQPWGEYQRRGQHRLSPIQFVDALARSNLGLSGVILEINAGYGPNASFARDLLSISRLIDIWSQIGVQLHVDIACPSKNQLDPESRGVLKVVDGVWRQEWNEASQAEWMEHVVPLLLAKPAVTGVFLSQFSDRLPHRFPHGGLLRPDGESKQMLHALREQLHCNLD